MIAIIPSLIYLITNIIIFKYACSSSNRVQKPSTIPSNNLQQHINRRDMHLLRHMIIMFCIFIGGWSPLYIYMIIVDVIDPTLVVASLLILLTEMSLLVDIIDLFLYNHELRKYLRNKIFKRT